MTPTMSNDSLSMPTEDGREDGRPFGQPAGAPSGLSPQAVSSEAAHQAHDTPLRREVIAVINEMSRLMPNATEDWRIRLTEALL